MDQMDIAITTSDPNQVDIDEIRTKLTEELDYPVASIRVRDRETGMVVTAARYAGEETHDHDVLVSAAHATDGTVIVNVQRAYGDLPLVAHARIDAATWHALVSGRTARLTVVDSLAADLALCTSKVQR